jgi:hypothetical protein
MTRRHWFVMLLLMVAAFAVCDAANEAVTAVWRAMGWCTRCEG